MTTTIKIKNSVTTTNAPSSLQQGEVAINITDKKVWVGNAATTPVQLLGTGADGSFTNLAYSGTLTGGTGVINIGSAQFYKDASGNVGIGTSVPIAKLEVSGGAIAINTNTQFRTLEMYENGTRRAYFSYDSTNNIGNLAVEEAGSILTFNSAGSERMRIDAAGSVVVGSQLGQGARFEVISPQGNGMRITATGTSTGSGGRIIFSNQLSSGYGDLSTIVSILTNSTTATSAADLVFSTTSAGSTSEKMWLSGAGNLGIGVSSPNQRLSVLSSSNTVASITGTSTNAADFTFQNTSNGNYGNIGAMGSSGYGVGGWANSFVIESVSNSTGGLVLSTFSGPMVFQTNSRTERMRITNDGLLQFNSGYGSVATGYGCRSWVNFNGTGTVAIRASGNVSSITDNGTGDYTINFTNAMPDADYAYAGFGGQNLDGGYIQLSQAAAPTTSALRINMGSIPGVFNIRDALYVTVAVFR